MANAWQEVDWIAAEALTIMSDELVIANMAAKDKSADFNVRPNGYAVGDTVRIKTRPDYAVNEFSSTISTQDIRESTRSMAIEKHFDVSVSVTAREKSLDLESFSEQVIMPAARRIAEQVDLYTGTKITQAAGLFTSDDLFGSAADVANARKTALLQQLDPERMVLMNPDLEAKVLGQTWFNQSQTRGGDGTDTLRSGNMGRVMGMDFYSSVNFPSGSHTPGDGTTTTDNTGSANAIGATTLTFDSLTGTIESGDRIVIAGVKRPLIAAAQATATATSVAIVDPITEIIPDGAAVTVVSSGNTVHSYQGAIFDSQSLAVAFPMLDAPSDKPSSVISDNGVGIRVVQGYDMTTKTETLSLDVLMGAACYDPRRITLLGEY
jgi:hypothetical protein